MASCRRVILLALVALSSNLVNAHMEMSWPYSFRSKYNPQNTDPDYSNTSPLNADGSNFPCKNYQDLASAQAAVTEYQPGSTYNLTLAGTATHDGGSCQISLSYDNGQTFNVIKSMIGGCTLKDNWQFTIPSYAAPSDSVILAWTWFNIVGNREMYMQCAHVAIASQSIQRYRRTSIEKRTSISQLPPLFTCNINNGCTTLENHEVIFPQPGTSIERNADAIAALPGPGYTLSASSSGNANSPVSTPGSFIPLGSSFNVTNNTTSSETSTVSMTRSSSLTTFYSITTTMPRPLNVTFTTITTTSTTTIGAPTTTSSSATASATGSCTPGQFTCVSSTSFSQCVGNADGSSSYVYMGSVAAGMQCLNGTIIRQDDGPCTPDGALQCEGSSSFYLCTNGGLVDMGPLAAGTTCSNGTISTI